MMKNSNPAFTLSGRTKIFLYICLGALAVIDFTAFVYLAATGISADFWLFPLLFFIADGIFIVQAVFTNFRFRYAVSEIVFYLLMTFVVLILNVSQNIAGSVSVFTTSASAIWILIHVVSLVAALILYLYTAKRIRSMTILQTVIAFAVTAVCAFAAVAYVTLTVDFGFFGQGSAGVRPLAYEYDEESDSYAVTGILKGNGDEIIVPESFNGKPVKSVTSYIFAVGAKSVTLQCSPDVTFTDNKEYAMNVGLKIYTDREKIDAFRSAFYKLGQFDIANNCVPENLEEDEVFVTFKYDISSYALVDGEILPTYIGKKGERLNLDYFKGVSYAEHSNQSSDSDLYWNFNNNKNRIISSISADQSENLIGKEITENVEGAFAYFNKIYRIYPVAGNDSKYDINKDFRFSQVGGEKLEYKLTVADNAEDTINYLSRSGFELEWLQCEYSYSTPQTMTSIKSALNKLSSGSTDLYVYPSWTLNAPAVTVTQDKDSVVYGGNITMSATVVPPVEGMNVIYNWRKSVDGYTYGWDSDFTVENVAFDDGSYVLVATVSGENTSLVSDKVVPVAFTVTKKPLTVNWSIPENLTYEGAQKTVSCIISGGIINDDEVYLDSREFKHRDAGNYTDEVTLVGADSRKYSISAGQSNTITINKADLKVNWLTNETVYNGYEQSPEVSVEGVFNDEVEYTVSKFINAGAYTARFTATTGGENYNIIDGTSSFTIKRYALSVDWGTDVKDEFTYDGKYHMIKATAEGINGDTINLTVNRPSIKNAGTYNITASLSYTNYEITSGATKTYTINKYGLTVEWGETALTYNGVNQAPEYTMKGVEGDGNILGSRNGGKKDVGENYVCEMTGITAQYDWEKNYYIADNAQTTFSIGKAEVEVKWQVASYYYYDGTEQKPTAWIVGLGDDASVSLTCAVTGATNAGTHTAEATFNHELAKNYTLKNTTKQFTIQKKLIEITVHDYDRMTYGDGIPEFTYAYTQLAQGDSPDEVFPNLKTTVKSPNLAGGFLVPGDYKVVAEYEKGTKTDNYSITCNDGNLKVNKKEIKVKIDDKQITLGDPLPEFTYTVTGLVGGTAESDVIKSFRLFEGEVTEAGVYNIMIDEYGEGIINLYTVSAVHGKLTVNEAQTETPAPEQSGADDNRTEVEDEV